jgi:hypothetical protein
MKLADPKAAKREFCANGHRWSDPGVTRWRLRKGGKRGVNGTWERDCRKCKQSPNQKDPKLVRRKLVLEYSHSNLNGRQIAKQVGCSEMTVSRDRAWLMTNGYLSQINARQPG